MCRVRRRDRGTGARSPSVTDSEQPLAEVRSRPETTAQGLHGQRGLREVAERLEDVAEVPGRLGDAGTARRALRAGAGPVVALQRPHGDLTQALDRCPE